jgi:hypothetical protein
MDTSNLGCLVLAMTRLQNLRTASGLKQACLSLWIFRTLILESIQKVRFRTGKLPGLKKALMPRHEAYGRPGVDPAGRNLNSEGSSDG